jgi:hypothetical protein
MGQPRLTGRPMCWRCYARCYARCYVRYFVPGCFTVLRYAGTRRGLKTLWPGMIGSLLIPMLLLTTLSHPEATVISFAAGAIMGFAGTLLVVIAVFQMASLSYLMREMRPRHNSQTRWFSLLACGINESALGDLYETGEIMRLQGHSQQAVVREMVKQIILLLLYSGFYRAVNMLMPFKKAKLD